MMSKWRLWQSYTPLRSLWRKAYDLQSDLNNGNLKWEKVANEKMEEESTTDSTDQQEENTTAVAKETNNKRMVPAIQTTTQRAKMQMGRITAVKQIRRCKKLTKIAQHLFKY